MGLEQATEHGMEPASIKFHPESGLLIIKGNSVQTGVVKQVIDRLKEGSDSKWSLMRDQEVRKMEDQLRSARGEIETLKVKLAESQADASRLKAMLEDLQRVSPGVERKK
jgi:predicted RNase H-like nuclease (RuvC/YqgF family)